MGHEYSLPLSKEPSRFAILTEINFFHCATAPSGSGPPHYWGFIITLRHTTLAGLLWTSDQPDAQTSPDYTQHSQESDISAGLEPAIPASKRLQPHALDRVATGIGDRN
jgi:hypothetical protein